MYKCTTQFTIHKYKVHSFTSHRGHRGLVKRKAIFYKEIIKHIHKSQLPKYLKTLNENKAKFI